MESRLKKATCEFRASKLLNFTFHTFHAVIAPSLVSLIRTIPSVQEFHLLGASRRSRTVTAGEEFHLALKQIMFYFPLGKTYANYYSPPKRVCK